VEDIGYILTASSQSGLFYKNNSGWFVHLYHFRVNVHVRFAILRSTFGALPEKSQ